MGDLELTFVASGSSLVEDHSPEHPAWDGNTSIPNWWQARDNTADYAYSKIDNAFFVQYGFNLPLWATARFMYETVDINSEHKNPDGSISAHVTVNIHYFWSERTNYFKAGVPVRSRADVNGHHLPQYDNNEDTGKIIRGGPSGPLQFDITVPAQETSWATALHLNYVYPNGDYVNNEMWIGIGLYNPIPPTYVPMALRRSNEWKDLNTNNGFIHIRKNSTWEDRSQEEVPTIRQVDTGHNRIRKDGKWLQLPPMSGGSAE